jgi:hypothetical protein
MKLIVRPSVKTFRFYNTRLILLAISQIFLFIYNYFTGDFDCLPESPCTGITLQNINLKSPKGFTCANINGTTSGVNPSICF